MKTLVPGITVNGVKITAEQINAEVQYHPAPTLLDAKYEAMQALVIRELLIQRAVTLGLCSHEEAVTKTDELVDAVLEAEISIPEPDEETCLRYYTNNKQRFFTSPLFEVSHILYLAPPEDKAARAKALRRAQDSLAQLKKKPDLFARIAKEESGCSSSGEGGRLGQIGKGQTLPAFEAALMTMQEGDLSSQPVETAVGYHIIKVHKREDGRQLPFEAVADWIRDFLKQQSWQRAFSQYVQLLAGNAEISGFRLKQADTPLVQ